MMKQNTVNEKRLKVDKKLDDIQYEGLKTFEDYLRIAEFDYKDLAKDLAEDLLDASEVDKIFCKLFQLAGAKENIFTANSEFEKWENWKNRGGIDPDDSNQNNPNPFIRAIYYLLWGKRINLEKEIEGKSKGIYENGWGRFSTSYICDKKYVWGGETMNTIGSYLPNDMDEDLKKRLNILCKNSHKVGNFVLVPAYFNRWKGMKLKDRMDIALSELKENKKGYSLQWGANAALKGQHKENNMNTVVNKFKSLEQEDFNLYINMFFLWDYIVVENGDYKIKNMWIKEGNNEAIENYVENARRFIERRNIFIATMLYIAQELKDNKEYEDRKDWNEWNVSTAYKIIVNKVFLQNRVFNNYQEIVTEVKKFIDNFERKNELVTVLEVSLNMINEI